MSTEQNFIVNFFQTNTRRTFWAFIHTCRFDIIKYSTPWDSVGDFHNFWLHKYLHTLKNFDISVYNDLHERVRIFLFVLLKWRNTGLNHLDLRELLGIAAW